jgi:hypothetical protein
MSSPRATVAKARRPRAVPPATKATGDGGQLSAEATRLAAALERALADGRSDVLSPEALQALMAALCRTYGAQIEAGQQVLPLKERTSVTSTDVMTTASGLLRSANLAVFELGMWQSWTGR